MLAVQAKISAFDQKPNLSAEEVEDLKNMTKEMASLLGEKASVRAV